MATRETCDCEYPCSCATKKILREELEIAWLGGYAAAESVLTRDCLQAAADYAERVVGGSTGPERPQ